MSRVEILDVEYRIIECADCLEPWESAVADHSERVIWVMPGLSSERKREVVLRAIARSYRYRLAHPVFRG